MDMEGSFDCWALWWTWIDKVGEETLDSYTDIHFGMRRFGETETQIKRNRIKGKRLKKCCILLPAKMLTQTTKPQEISGLCVFLIGTHARYNILSYGEMWKNILKKEKKSWFGNRKVKSEVAQLCPTLCDPVDCSPPGSSIHGILQARILEWVAISFSRGSSRPRDGTQVSHIAGRSFNLWATRKQKGL